MFEHPDDIAPEAGKEEPLQVGSTETRSASPEVACPVCHRVMPAPPPEICPHCQAPIHQINALLRTADLSIEEAVRDLNIGDLDSVERRLQLVKATSREHRLKAEIVQAMLDRLKGDPTTALARLRAVREKIDPSDTELIELVDTVELSALKDQEALSACCEHYNFALFQARIGHYEEARAAAGRALGWVPHHAPAHALLGKVHYLLGEQDPAAYHLERALAVDPTNRSASRLLGRMRQASSFSILKVEKIKGFLRENLVSIFVVLALLTLALAALLAR